MTHITGRGDKGERKKLKIKEVTDAITNDIPRLEGVQSKQSIKAKRLNHQRAKMFGV